MVFGSSIAVQRTSDPNEDSWRGWLDHTLLILLIAALTWLLASLVLVAERRAIARYGGGDVEIADEDRQWRRIRTQVTVLRRLAIADGRRSWRAAILMTFPRFSDIGTTVFASAGVLSVVAGLAAQTSLGAVFAGMQIAFSGAIRVGDVVTRGRPVVGPHRGDHLSYVVVRLWDERRLVLPCTTSPPSRSRTGPAAPPRSWAQSNSTSISVPFDEMRAELDRPARRQRALGRRARVLQVTDAVGGVVQVRIVVSAPNAGALFDLRCSVRKAWSIGCNTTECCRRNASRPRRR